MIVKLKVSLEHLNTTVSCITHVHCSTSVSHYSTRILKLSRRLSSPAQPVHKLTIAVEDRDAMIVLFTDIDYATPVNSDVNRVV